MRRKHVVLVLAVLVVAWVMSVVAGAVSTSSTQAVPAVTPFALRITAVHSGLSVAGSSQFLGAAVVQQNPSNAALNPFCAARPPCRLLHMLPNISRKPAACVAAMPSAQVMRCSFSPSSLPAAAAAPKVPAVPVMCQPRA